MSAERIPIDDDHCYLKVDGSYMTCVSCGKPEEFHIVGNVTYGCHKCSASHEAHKQAGDTAGKELGVERRKSFGERLNEAVTECRRYEDIDDWE